MIDGRLQRQNIRTVKQPPTKTDIGPIKMNQGSGEFNKLGVSRFTAQLFSYEHKLINTNHIC